MSDPFADLFPRRRDRERERAEREQERPPERVRDQPPKDVFVEHAHHVLLTRWGTSLSRRVADLPGGAQVEFPLVSGNGRIVGEVPWLDGMGSAEWKSAALSEHVWVLSHVVADRRFLLVGHDIDLVTRWVARRRGMLDGVEVWSLDDDQLERLA